MGAATAFIPVALAGAAIAFVDYREWHGSLILAAVRISVLFLLGWLLKGKPSANGKGVLLSTILPIICIELAIGAKLGNALSAIVFYVFFLGFGEELLFRGYIQSRLNYAFGKPFKFIGVNCGWGIVITSALFGFMHVLNVGSLVDGRLELAWWWGFWTFFGGLVLGFVREKSGSIIAPAILHGLPQAIAYAVLGKSYQSYCALLALFDRNGMLYEWRYYMDGKAWLCKVQKKKKTIVWMSAWKGFIKAAIYIPEKHLERVYEIPVSDETKERIRTTGNVGKSKPCIFEIRNQKVLKDMEKVMQFRIQTK